MIYPYVSDLHHFYKTPSGRHCQYFLGKYIKKFSQNTDSCGIIGYGVPYQQFLRNFLFSVIPSQQGIDFYEKKSLCLSQIDALPLRNRSLDFLLVIHCFEFYDQPQIFLQEIHRVLKDHGIVIIVVPHFLNYWFEKFDSPFNLGKKYTPFKIQKWLKQSDFTLELIKSNFSALSGSYFYKLLQKWRFFEPNFLSFCPNITIYQAKKNSPAFIFYPKTPLKIISNC